MISLNIGFKELLVVLIVIGSFTSCKKTDPINEDSSSKYYKVNLFPEQTKQESSSQISLEKAIELSDKVVVSNKIVLVDISSKDRSVKEFYLYKVYNAKTIKGNKDYNAKQKSKDTTTTSFYFYSDKLLSFNQASKDSVYVFLKSNKDKKIITRNHKIDYKWLLESGIIPL
ncbi:hypothetical protein LNQ81_12800 [Myroides sp. M-43]|uniref:hypothetical protein n=1 Tax=Myroides oncorhynchi TaxID=2893756 RepID=UPI001E5CA25F|nr:hypothetical protein [Myroides oncorhynchi]MCC9043552.1 hypothetical protein [Myroides oncorhynchi]